MEEIKVGMTETDKTNKENDIILDFQKIAKIQHLYMGIFNEEDSDYPDYRVIRPKERSIEKMLDSFTKDREKQKEIYNTIREKGYKIINNE